MSNRVKHMINVLIRADSNSEIGMGHFIRCSALACEFLEQGHKVFLATSKNSIIPDWAEELYKNKFYIEKEWDIYSEEKILKKLSIEIGIDVMIIDTYKAGSDYYKLASEYYKLIAAFDDNGDISVPVDVVINGNIYAERLDYGLYNNKSVFLLGTNYLAMRPQFKSSTYLEVKKEVIKVLITFGGGDLANATPAVLETLLEKSKYKNLEYSVLIGPGFTNVEQIKKVSQGHGNVNLIYNPKDVASIMRGMDIAICTASSTIYELSSLGIPSIIFVVADNQKNISEEMQNRGISISAGKFSIYVLDNFIAIFDEMASNYEMRKEMHTKAINTFNVSGAKNCVNSIVNYLLEKEKVN